MAKASPATDKCINRRTVLKGGAALAAAGPALLRGGYAEAQPRANGTTALFAYVGAFTPPERKGHGGGINVYRVDPTSGAWSHEQLLEIANPSFLRSTGRSAFSIRCMPTSMRSVHMRSTSRTDVSQRSTGSPVVARTRRTCR